jgi:hypothetical protein
VRGDNELYSIKKIIGESRKRFINYSTIIILYNII